MPIFLVIVTSWSHSNYSPNNHRRPIRHSHQRTRNETDGLQWFLFDIELPVEPVEADVESTGGFERLGRDEVQEKDAWNPDIHP